MTGLFGAKQVSGAADFQVPHGDLDAGTELGEVPDCRQAFFRVFGENLVSPECQIGRRPAGGASHPAANLVELREAQTVGVLHNQGVHIRNVNTGFNDSGADQHLGLPGHNAVHHAGQFVLIHFPVGNGDADIFQHLGKPVRRPVDILNPVVEIVDLSSPLQFPPDGVRNQAPVMLHDKGLNRNPVFWRFIDGGHVADAAEGHVHCPRNRGCRKRQHINPPGEFLDVFFVRHAEALLLIHNQEPEIFKPDIFGKQPVGSDHQIAFPALQIFQGLAVPSAVSQAAEGFNLHRETEKALQRRLVVLLGQDGGRHKNGRLLSVQHAFHDGAERHLCFPEADIPAQQPVHRDRGFHVPLDFRRAAKLVVRFRIGEVFLKFPLPAAVR